MTDPPAVERTGPLPQRSVFTRPEGATEVLLIRHGRSADLIAGDEASADPPLHRAGHQQAEALARRLTPATKAIDAFYSSDLRRAVQTAEILARRYRLAVHQRHDLREVELGQWELGHYRRLAEIADPAWVAHHRSGRWDLVPGSEGDARLRQRVVAAVDAIVEDHRGSTVAVVCHGGVINAYLAELFANPRSYFTAIENTSVSVVRVLGDLRTPQVINDCSHLYDPVVGPLPPEDGSRRQRPEDA